MCSMRSVWAHWYSKIGILFVSINQNNLLKYSKVKHKHKIYPKIKGKVVFSSVPFFKFEILQLNYVSSILPFNGIHSHTVGGKFLSKTFYRQIEHKGCDQVKEKMVNIDECLLTDFGYTCKYLLTQHYQARSAWPTSTQKKTR